LPKLFGNAEGNCSEYWEREKGVYCSNRWELEREIARTIGKWRRGFISQTFREMKEEIRDQQAKQACETRKFQKGLQKKKGLQIQIQQTEFCCFSGNEGVLTKNPLSSLDLLGASLGHRLSGG